DQQPLRNNEVLAENDPEDTVSKRNISSFERGNDFDESSENSIARLLWNGMPEIENDLDDNLTREITDETTAANGSISSLDIDYSMQSDNITSVILDDSTYNELPTLWINRTYQVSFRTTNTLRDISTRKIYIYIYIYIYTFEEYLRTPSYR
uniref:SCHIP-1 domain-containing protein n=1 Tax=Elaeophora elaphi TaxID=1147741 RepID=A0A0R3RP11_9BILA